MKNLFNRCFVVLNILNDAKLIAKPVPARSGRSSCNGSIASASVHYETSESGHRRSTAPGSVHRARPYSTARSIKRSACVALLLLTCSCSSIKLFPIISHSTVKINIYFLLFKIGLRLWNFKIFTAERRIIRDTPDVFHGSRIKTTEECHP